MFPKAPAMTPTPEQIAALAKTFRVVVTPRKPAYLSDTVQSLVAAGYFDEAAAAILTALPDWTLVPTTTTPEAKAAAMWAALEADPEFVEGMRRAEADIAAGRVTRYELVPTAEVERIADLLNSLGIAGPNIRHGHQAEPDPKWSHDERAVWDLTKDQRWCFCGREWPCEALELATLTAALTGDAP